MKSKNEFNPLSPKIRQRLRKILRARLLEDQEDLWAYSYDASGMTFLPEAVALPETGDEVAAILRLASEEHFPVIPRGAGTATTGAPLAVAGGLVLSLTRMNRILEINEEDLVAVVEPGVPTGRLKEEVAYRGLFYPPDPASYQFSTIGGNVATCAGGPKGLKYGVTKDYVLGLEVALASGELVFLGTRTVKGVVGYDLVHLFVGSEGTLGVITKIVLKLLPKPRCQAVAMVGFKTLEEAATSFGQILKRGILPATAELMDEVTIRATSQLLGSSLPKEIKALLILEVDGPELQVKEELKALKEVLTRPFFYQEALQEGEREEIWRVRRSISPALKTIAPNKIADDVVLPRRRVVQFLNFVKKLSIENDLIIACFGHLGDGNIHVNLLFDAADPSQREKALSCREKILNEVLRLSGTISGEHGLGFSKRGYFPREIPPVAQNLMYQLKKIFDPAGILNPGKIFPPH